MANTRQSPPESVRRTVHPHARGEHQLLIASLLAPPGSSPRQWGTHHSVVPAGALHRFIPTPVGNTFADRMKASSISVHPHARGEHPARSASSSPVAGSSPRPWGTLELEPKHFTGVRFIPTPVGNTAVRGRATGRMPVHPHARGEHNVALRGDSRKGGSSPRPWGTLSDSIISGLWRRFIPTPVGNTKGGAMKQPPYVGSSPRPWGTLISPYLGIPVDRFIPTPVGNTPTITR